MKRLNPAYIEAVKQKVNQSPYFRLLSMEVQSLGWGESQLEVEVQEKHLQPFGMVHGGVYSSLVDAAAFWAVYPTIEEKMGLTSVELKLNFLAPAASGLFIARGKTVKAGKTLCLGEASIENGSGRLLAHGTSTMMILKEVKIKGESAFPPKFLEG
jgi:uncharacterized protein (TIGR00369 family)